MKNRGNKILELLTKDNKIEVSHLAEELGVSQVTMRKDLDTLESKGVIKREHGLPFFVVRMILTEELPITMRRKEKLRRKRQDWFLMEIPL